MRTEYKGITLAGLCRAKWVAYHAVVILYVRFGIVTRPNHLYCASIDVP